MKTCDPTHGATSLRWSLGFSVAHDAINSATKKLRIKASRFIYDSIHSTPASMPILYSSIFLLRGSAIYCTQYQVMERMFQVEKVTRLLAVECGKRIPTIRLQCSRRTSATEQTLP